jgi:hypothetical protein
MREHSAEADSGVRVRLLAWMPPLIHFVCAGLRVVVRLLATLLHSSRYSLLLKAAVETRGLDCFRARECSRPDATSVCGLELLVCGALSY